jgi:hypothetical protein
MASGERLYGLPLSLSVSMIKKLVTASLARATNSEAVLGLATRRTEAPAARATGVSSEPWELQFVLPGLPAVPRTSQTTSSESVTRGSDRHLRLRWAAAGGNDLQARVRGCLAVVAGERGESCVGARPSGPHPVIVRVALRPTACGSSALRTPPVYVAENAQGGILLVLPLVET